MRGFCLLSVAGILLTACSFDYGIAGGTDKTKPDIVMENLNYVRVRGGDPLVSFKAEHAERYEERQTMEIRNFSFEQLQNSGNDINAEGRAGSASVQLSSGNISLKDGVKINVKSEDFTIWTGGLEWKDKEKTLSGAAEDEVDIERSDGTSFTGKGFSADARNRIWTFSGEVKGQYVEKEDNKKDTSKTETTEPAVTSGDQTQIPGTGEEPVQSLSSPVQPPSVPEASVSAPAQPQPEQAPEPPTPVLPEDK